MSAAPTGVAVVGCGFIAREHLRAYRRAQRAVAHRVVALVDPIAERAEALASEFGIERTVARVEDVLALDEVDAVDICTPTPSHHALALRVLDAGRHVLIEKPITLDLDEAKAVIAAADAAGRTAMVGHSARFDAMGRALREHVDSGELGPLLMIDCASWFGYFWGGGWTAWQIDAERSGGNIVHNGIHDIDLVCSLFGAAPTSVFARGARLASDRLDTNDYFHVVMGFDGGRCAATTLSYSVVPPGASLRTMLVTGEEGTAAYDSARDRLVWSSGGATLPILGGDDPYVHELTHWLECIASGSPPRVPTRQAAVALEVALAAEESARTGRAVELDARAYA